MDSMSSPSSMLHRRQSFLTVHREYYNRLASLELLIPTYESTQRKSTPAIAILNLVATVCGGGVLSLPLAFLRVGIMPALFMLVLSAVMTNFCLYILCSCARRTGGRSYGDVAKAAFGPLAQVVTTLILFVLLVGILVAYMVLVQDIWTPIIVHLLQVVWPLAEVWLHKDGDAVSDALLAGLLVLISPFLLKRDLYALRHTCYVGFVSLILLTIGLTVRAFQRNVVMENTGLNSAPQSIKWWTTEKHDIIFAFPIVALSFLSSFNVLSVHGSLIRPTRDRVRLVLNGAVGICLFLFSMVGLGGYLCSYDDTKDNVFLNFDMTDRLLLIARIGYGFTLLFAMPLVTLPCREALLTIPDQLHNWQHDTQLLRGYRTASSDHVFNDTNKEKMGPHFMVNGVDFDAETLPLTAKSATPQSSSPYGTLSETLDLQEAITPTPALTPAMSDQDLADATVSEYAAHILSTAAIVGFSYVAAVAVPGVATVWSIAGSSMAMIISFIIPAACYLKIRWEKRINLRSMATWALLIFSIVAAVVCTSQTVSDIFTASMSS